jgi:hypothetical protein
MNRERVPLAASLILLGIGAGFTGVQSDEGIYLTVAGFCVIGIGFLTLFSKGPANAIRSFDVQPVPVPRVPEGMEARVAWSGDGTPPQEVRDALKRMGIALEPGSGTKVDAGTRVFTAHMGPGGIETNEDDLRERGITGSALIRRAKTLGMELGERTLVELILTVHLPGRDPYQVKDLTMVPNDQLITVGANLTVPVLVDPDDQTRLMVDWEAG